jgi:hypothetical protein
MFTLPSLQQFSVAIGLLASVVGFLRLRRKSPPPPNMLEKLLAYFLGASSIPTAFFLVWCAFRPTYITGLTDLPLWLAAAGLALFYVSIKAVTAE